MENFIDGFNKVFHFSRVYAEEIDAWSIPQTSGTILKRNYDRIVDDPSVSR